MRRADEPALASRRATTRLARLIIAGSLATLAGWQLGSVILTSLLPGRVAMNPLTALAVFMAAVSLSQAAATKRRTLTRLLAATILMLGAACIACYCLGANLRIDRLFYARDLGENRIAPNTGACFFIAGMALLALTMERGHKTAEVLGTVLAGWTFLSVVGYIFGSRSFYGVGSYIPMALNTAILLNLLALGIVLAAAESWLASLVDTATAYSLIARRLIPAAVSAPLLCGWLRLRGQQAGLYDTEFGAALLVVSTAVISVVVIVWAVKSVERALADSDRIQTALRDRETQFALMAESIRDYAIFLLDRDGNVSTWNDGAQRIKGYTAKEIIGRHFSCFYPPKDLARGRPLKELTQAAQEERIRDEGWRVRADGTRFWAYTVMTAMFDNRGALRGFLRITRDMTAQKEFQQSLSDLNDDLERRVELRTEELAAANRDLEENKRENETFVYSVSHDLRSPLVNLQGFSAELDSACDGLVEILNAEKMTADGRDRALQLLNSGMREPLHFIRTAVIRLSTIIDALLRLSRVGRIEYQLRDVNLNDLVRRIVDSMRVTVAERGAEVILNPLPTVHGDPVAVEQVFANLIGNAVNYLDPARRGTIEVGVCDPLRNHNAGERRSWTFFVRDNGLGIARASQMKIFQAFQRLHPGAAPGEGIGLAIVRRVVERHSGQIWLESTENVGTTFFVSLPAAADASQDPTADRGAIEQAPAGARAATEATSEQQTSEPQICHAN